MSAERDLSEMRDLVGYWEGRVRVARDANERARGALYRMHQRHGVDSKRPAVLMAGLQQEQAEEAQGVAERLRDRARAALAEAEAEATELHADGDALTLAELYRWLGDRPEGKAPVHFERPGYGWVVTGARLRDGVLTLAGPADGETLRTADHRCDRCGESIMIRGGRWWSPTSGTKRCSVGAVEGALHTPA